MLRARGGRFGPHLLTADGRHLLACVAKSLRVYSAVTGEYLFSLQHDGEVAAASLHPTHDHQVYAATVDGWVVLWDLTSRSALRTVAAPAGVESMVVRGSQAFLACRWRGVEAGRVLAYDLITGQASEHRTKVSSARQLTLSRNGEWLATVDRHTVLLWHATEHTRPPLVLGHTKALTCVAVSSNAERVAAGDVTGRIIVWHDASATALAKVDPSGAGPPPVPPSATVHWHADAVSCLAFSNDDAYLLSGGQEAVLVMWDVANGSRMYLPRLGGPLLGIATCWSDPAKYAIRQADNTLRVVNMATLRVESSVHGLRPAAISQQGSPFAAAPMAVQPRTGLLALAGSHSVLQFYDVNRDVHIDKLQLSAQSVGLVGSHSASTLPIEPMVTQLAFSSDGSVLVTIESCSSRGCGLGTTNDAFASDTLKFWERRQGEGYGSPYVLIASAEHPHRSASGSGTVTGLAYHPLEDLLVTTSGSEFRLWRRDHMIASLGGSTTWICNAVASYRGEPMCTPVFSPDGSLLAVAAGSTVTLWDVHQLSLAGVMDNALVSTVPAPIRTLLFLPDSQFLVAASASRMAVLNVLTSSTVWALDVPTTALAADIASDHFAAVVETDGTGKRADALRAVVLFSSSSKRPCHAWMLEPSAGWLAPLQLAFLAPTALPTIEAHMDKVQHSTLLLLSGGRQFVLLTQYNTIQQALAVCDGMRNRGNSADDTGFVAQYGQLLPQEPATSTQIVDSGSIVISRHTFTFTGTASHALPPVQELCPEFLLQMLSLVSPTT